MNDNLTNQPLSLAYTCRGSGPDLLLVHGFASSVRNWDALIPALEADFRCWAVDLPGFGDTCIDAEREVTLDEHVAHLLRFVETHDLHPQAIIGHSMGGMLTLKLALAEPSLARQLVLVAPTVTGKFFWGANYLVATPVVKTLMNISRPAWELLHTEAAKPLIVTPHYLPMEVRERIREDLQRSCWGAVKSAINGMAETDLGPELPSITQPTLVIIGDSDEMVPNSEGMLAAERMPNATLLKLPGVHHVVLDEAPDTTGPAIRQFLRGS